MAARVDVLEGPDKGWRYTIIAGDARIGRGPGSQIRLSDPAWPVGSIRIRLRGGGYLVANDLPHPVYLDGEPLPPAEERNLYHGATLQPTRGTLLRLGIVATPGGAENAGPVIAEPPAKTRRVVTPGRVLCAVMLLAAGGTYGYAYLRGAPRVDGAEAARHKEALVELEVNPAVDPRAVPQVRLARIELARAVYADAKGAPADALAKYRAARDGLVRARRAVPSDDPAAAPLRAAEEFVTARLKATTGR